MRGEHDRIFYGWWIVAAAFLILLISVGVAIYTPPIFLVPLELEFGWGRATIAGAGAVAALAAGLVSPLVGVWIDRYGSRRVMTIGALVMGLAFGLMSLIQSVWQLYACNALAAVGVSCVAWIPNQTLVSNWFERRRGLAMGIAVAGIGFGGLAMAPLAALLIAQVGWRVAYASLGLTAMTVIATVAATVMRTRPADLGLLPDGEAGTPGPTEYPSVSSSVHGPPPGLGLAESLHTSALWILCLGNFLFVFGFSSITTHFVAFLRDTGLDDQQAAGALGLTVGVSVAGRLVFGALADRLDPRGIMALALALAGIATLFLFRIEAPGALLGFIVLFGLSLGGGAVMLPLLVGEYYGLAAFGKILGLTMVAATLGAATGPVLTGRIYDLSGSYSNAVVLALIAFLSAATAVLFLRKPAPG